MQWKQGRLCLFVTERKTFNREVERERLYLYDSMEVGICEDRGENNGKGGRDIGKLKRQKGNQPR